MNRPGVDRRFNIGLVAGISPRTGSRQADDIHNAQGRPVATCKRISRLAACKAGLTFYGYEIMVGGQGASFR